MNGMTNQPNRQALRWGAVLIILVAGVLLISKVAWGAGGPAAPAGGHQTQPRQAAPVATPGQDFEDVFPSNAFYSYLHNLYLAGIVSGYTCIPSGPNDPCVPPDNLPYYHPGVAVTRLQ